MTPEHVAQIRKIIALLKISDFSILLGKTNYGELCFKIPKDDEPHFTLDSIPVNKDTGRELAKILKME